MNIEDFRKEVKGFIKDDSEVIKQEGLDRNIGSALDQYDKDRAREVTEDIDGDGTYDYELIAVLTDWSEGFSHIKQIEYPAGESQDPSDNYLDDDAWMIYDDGSKKYLRFLKTSPASGEKIRVTHTTPHALDDSESTIPDCDFRAVCYLSASLSCLELAAYYTQHADMKAISEYADLMSKAEDYRGMAEEYGKNYEKLIGIGEETRVKASSAVAQYDIVPKHGRGRLTH